MFNRKLFALVLGGFVGAAAVQAEGQQGYVGALVGGQTIKGSGDSVNQFAFGANAGALLMDGTVGLGAHFTWGKKDGFKTMYYGIDANYYWKDVAPGLFTGIKVGMEKNETNAPFDLGVAVGYDYALASNFTLGAEVAYLRVFSKGVVDAHNTFNYLVSGKYWF